MAVLYNDTGSVLDKRRKYLYHKTKRKGSKTKSILDGGILVTKNGGDAFFSSKTKKGY